jgi:1,4-dihydroxy-2-naphthoate octaprenyltransferase
MTKLLRLTRPQFMLASLALFILGSAWGVIRGAAFPLARFLLGYLVILPAQLSNAFCNDCFDLEVDRGGSRNFFSGGTGVLLEHPELRRPAMRIALALTGCSLALGILFVRLYAFPLWFLGLVVLGNFLGWFYSAPPLRLSYRGLGELSTALIAGLLVPSMGYLVTRGRLDGDGLLLAIPLVLYSLAFILAVEIPDMEADRLGGKHTWVAQRGRAFGFSLVGVFLMAATGFFFFLPWLPAALSPQVQVRPPDPGLNFRLLGLFSLLPLAPGLLGLLKRPAGRRTATWLAGWMVSGLAGFFFLADVYMIYAAAR